MTTSFGEVQARRARDAAFVPMTVSLSQLREMTPQQRRTVINAMGHAACYGSSAALASAWAGFTRSAEDADRAIREMDAIMRRDYAPYRAYRARKRTAKYLTKGGVRK